MATAKNYKVQAKSAFTGTRPLSDVPGVKKFKPKDVPFFKGLSEALTKKEAEALASQFDYKVVGADGGGNEELKSEDMSAEDAIAHIESTSIEELEGFLSENPRKTVQAAWDAKHESK